MPVRRGVAQGSLAQGSPAQGWRHKVTSQRLFSHGCFLNWRYIVFLLFVTVFFVFQCFLRCCCIDGAGMEPPDAQLCRAGWVMCHEGGAVVAETYWGALRVPHAPSVKPGAAYCCHCLFAWSPSGTPISPGPRMRLFRNDGSVAARRSVTLCAQTTKPDISHEQFTGNPMFFPRSL